jgi:hypothetical protein
MTDGQSVGDTERSLQERIEEEMFVDPDRYYLCVSCGRLKHEDFFAEGARTCDVCHEAGQYSVDWQEAPDGDGYLYCADANQEKTKPSGDENALIYEDEYLTIRNHPMAPGAVSVQVGDQSPTITDARDVFEALGAFLRSVEPGIKREAGGDD